MGTTNIELIELAKCLSIPNFNCICKDEVNSILKQGHTNIFVNLNDSDKNVNGY